MNARGRRRFDDPARRIARGLMLLGSSVLLGVAGSTLAAQGGTGQARGQTAARDSVSGAFYAGTTANLRLSPDPMFTARVRCAECHTPAVDSAPASRRIAAMDRVCTTCHGTRFAGMLTRWNSGLEWRSRVVADYVQGAAGDSRLAGSSVARGEIRAAQRTLGAIAAGTACTTSTAPMACCVPPSIAPPRPTPLRATAPPRPALGPSVANVSRLTCHYGIEGRRDSVFGQSFAHGLHVVLGWLPAHRVPWRGGLLREAGTGRGTRDPYRPGRRAHGRSAARADHGDVVVVLGVSPRGHPAGELCDVSRQRCPARRTDPPDAHHAPNAAGRAGRARRGIRACAAWLAPMRRLSCARDERGKCRGVQRLSRPAPPAGGRLCPPAMARTFADRTCSATI